MHGVLQYSPAFNKGNRIDAVSKPSMKKLHQAAHGGAGNLGVMPKLRKRKEIHVDWKGQVGSQEASREVGRESVTNK